MIPKTITKSWVYKEVSKYFNFNEKKTSLWFMVCNPLLGNTSPLVMVKLGRYKKLKKFVKSALEENRR